MGNQTQGFDVCIIGSGAAGGFMAKELCEGGAKVIMLEAGKEVALGDLLSHRWPYQLPYANLRQEKQTYFYQGDVATSIRYETQDNVYVDRARVLGGRTMHWGASNRPRKLRCMRRQVTIPNFESSFNTPFWSTRWIRYANSLLHAIRCRNAGLC